MLPSRLLTAFFAAILPLVLSAASGPAAGVTAPVGFAAVAAHGLTGTTGGGNSTPVAVRTALEFRDARIATSFSHADDNVERNRGGVICLVDSRNLEPRAAKPPPDSRTRFELEQNFKSNVERAALQFNPPADWKWENRHELPYAYEPDAVEDVPALVRAGAGTLRRE